MFLGKTIHYHVPELHKRKKKLLETDNQVQINTYSEEDVRKALS